MKYLAYGSNLHPLRLERRIGDCELIGVTTLRGFRLAFSKRGGDGSGKCTLLESGIEQDAVYAVIYGIDTRARRRLDRHEGLGRGYELRWVELGDGSPACLYQASRDALDHGLKPYSWYRALVLAGAKYHRFPQWYCRRIGGIEAVEDVDRRRHERHVRLLEAMTRRPVANGAGGDDR